MFDSIIYIINIDFHFFFHIPSFVLFCCRDPSYNNNFDILLSSNFLIPPDQKMNTFIPKKQKALIHFRVSKLFFYCGGDDGDRTRDLIVANDTLSQLSYTPLNSHLGVLLLLYFFYVVK